MPASPALRSLEMAPLVIPFTTRFKHASADRGVAYTANKDYWKPGRPYLDRWKILAPAEEAARTAAFFAGQNDALKAGSRAQVEAVLAQQKEAQLSTLVHEANQQMVLKLIEAGNGCLVLGAQRIAGSDR